ncbi:hypothetical protein ALC53_11936 [Atta colombica]|uniref:Uncharacterized protein n=1 Tax=Atta colombica TaxID=520822 RepID=A0A195AZX6_9HYME|nr:hypothetical protein ALC53_11936 [Atta colombica]
MQRLAPSLMPATRYVSKQLADWSVLDQGEIADRRGSWRKRLRSYEENPRGSASTRSNGDIPFALHSFVIPPALYRCAVLGLEKLLFLPFYIVQYPSKSRDNTFNMNTILSFRFSLSLALAQLLSPFLSLPLARSVMPLHNSLLPTHTNPFPTSLYDQLCYISKI